MTRPFGFFVLALASGCGPTNDARAPRASAAAPRPAFSVVAPAASSGAGAEGERPSPAPPSAATAGSVPTSRTRSPSGVAAAVAPPEGTPRAETSDTQAFLAQLLPALRRCYERALEQNPKSTVNRYSTDVAVDGGVTAVRIEGKVDPTLVACMERAIRAERFPPALSGQTITVPLTESAP